MAKVALVGGKLRGAGTALWLTLVKEATPLLLAAGLWVGALGFYSWPVNPPAFWPIGGVGVALLALAFWRTHWLGVGLLALSVAWGLAAWQVARHKPLPWQQAVHQSHWVVGRVAEIRAQEGNPKRATLVLTPVAFFNLPHGQQLTTLRVGVWVSQLAGVVVGGTVAAPVKLLAPNAPAMPSVRDGRLWQWLAPRSATAFTSGRLEVTADGAQYLLKPTGLWPQFKARIAGWRQKIVTYTQGMGAGIPTALLVGEQRAIPSAVREAYRAAGLSHLLAISGMQLTLVGVGVFWLLRWLGAAVPTLALRVNLKLWAALGALGVVALYTLLAGAAPSVVRAALMVGLVLVAVLLGRVRGLLRGWALANVAILALQPHLAMSAGLQLSATATLALGLWIQHATPPKGVAGWAKASVLATLVAGAATAPIAVLHFGGQPALGLLGNVVAIPLMTLATYAGFAALVLWPLGLQALALEPLTWLTNLTSAWATLVAGLQPAYSPGLPATAALALACVALLTLLFVLARRWLWLIGLTTATIAGLLAWALFGPIPQRVVAQNGGAAWQNMAAVGQPPVYRLLWAEEAGEATRYARMAGLPQATPAAQPPACCRDEILLPPQTPAYFAYMQMYDEGGWNIALLACNRPWQQVAEACWRPEGKSSTPTKQDE